MTKEITTQENAFLSVLDKALNNEHIDADTIQKLLDVNLTVMDKQASIDFNQAMQKVQEELPSAIKRNKRNEQTHSNYADLEIVNKAIKPIYTKHGFSIAFSEGEADGDNVKVIAKVRHVSGHTEEYSTIVPMDVNGLKGNANKTKTHAKGSSLSYGRRYLTLMIFDIATTDDDGNEASEAKTITAKQMQVIERKFGDDSDRKAKFCEYFKIESISDLPSSLFDRAVATIDKSNAVKDNA